MSIIALPLLTISDSNTFCHRDNRIHRHTHSCSPVFPGLQGETPSEQDEQRLAEAAAPVKPQARSPSPADPSGREPPAPEYTPAVAAAPAPAPAAPQEPVVQVAAAPHAPGLSPGG